MKIGYARVSTGNQHVDLQIEVLTPWGCHQIDREKVSGLEPTARMATATGAITS
jgi:DNA invertase Pin-like site-specific DNA recombinase